MDGPIISMMLEDLAAVDGGAAEGFDFDEGWKNIDQTPVEADMEDLRVVLGDDAVQDVEGSASQLHSFCLLPSHLPKKMCASTT